MREIFKFSALLAAGLVSTALWTVDSDARDLTVVGFGGAAQVSLKDSLYAPFTKATGKPIKEDEWDGQLAKVRTQVESKTINWDVILTEGAELQIGCDEALFEPLDWKKIGDQSKLLPMAVNKCGLGTSAWSSVLVYDGDKIKDAPKTWADFWNVQKWPGKRGLRFSPKETLQQALLADGVAPADVAKVMQSKAGIDRAFKKLTELKPNIVWWKSGAESIQRLASGEVVMTAAWNGRPWAANKDNKRNFVTVWSAGHVLGFDSFAVLKGSPNKDLAMDFLAFWAQPGPGAARAALIPYGGPAKASYTVVAKDRLAELPSAPANAPYAAPIDYKFWVDNLESLNDRFNTWVSQ